MLSEKNILPLAVVKSEIDASLSQIEINLEAFDENRVDTSKLKLCVEHLKQLQGVFDMISLPGASLLCDAMAQATEAILNLHDEKRDEILTKISNAVVVLSRYLEYVQLTQKGLPELLFVSINELRSLYGAKPLTESHFFDLDLQALDIEQIKSVNLENIEDASTRRLRHMYQVGLLGSFRGENLKSNYKMMARALARLNGLYKEAHGGELLRICNAVLESLLEGKISLTKSRKLMLGRIDRQIKHLVSQGESATDEAGLVTLVKDCLYIIALAEPNTALISEVQKHYGLEKFNLNEKIIQQERELMTGPSASVMRSVSSALREEINIIKDHLDVMARAGNKSSELQAMQTDLRKIAHTLVMLGLPSVGKQLNNLLDKLSTGANDQPGDFEQNINQLADALVFIEQAIARIERNNTPLQSHDENNNEGHQLELDQVFTVVAKESRQGLSEVQRLMSDFAVNRSHTENLARIPEILHSSWGGILFLEIDRAAKLILQSAEFVKDNLLSENAKSLDTAKLNTLADALASIDYYLESYEEKKPISDGVLDIAEESLIELGYKISPASESAMQRV